MVEYDTQVLPKFVPGKKMKTPLLCDVERDFYWSSETYLDTYKERLLLKLNNPTFDKIRNTDKFKEIIRDLC